MHALSDATEAIVRTTHGDEREHYTEELVRTALILQRLLDPLLMAERGESN